LVIDFNPNEAKEITFLNHGVKKETVKRTQAYLGEKKGYEKVDGYYKNGFFEEVNKSRVPSDHFAHDALYQFEGPGWESEKAAYRLYLDNRNRTDIFGKKRPELVLEKIGKGDLISDSKESYTKMQEWGMDIFKVGYSLGIGSIATLNDSVITISQTDSIFCEVLNHDFLSGIKINYYGWKVNDKTYDAKVHYSIYAGGRLTECNVKLNNPTENLCTGLAKHESTEFINIDNKTWGCIALWGKQTLANDNLGIAVFYKKTNLIKLSEDNLNYLVILKPNDNELTYYFGAAWEQEQYGVKSKSDFIDYLNNELSKLSNSIIVNYNLD